MSDAQPPGLGARISALIDGGLGLIQTRLSLISVEVEEEGIRLGVALFNIILAALFLAFGLLALAVFVTVLLWDSHRLIAIGGATLFFVGMAVWTARNAQARLRQGKRLFSHSVAELQADRTALREGQ